MIPSTLFIPLGTGSIWQDNELRYALRSWEIYADITWLIIIGHKPPWLTNCDHYPWPHYLTKTEDILRKAQAAAHVTMVNPDTGTTRMAADATDPITGTSFIFANDDHFLLQPLKSLPNYSQGYLRTHKGGSDRFMDYVRFTAQLFPEGRFFDIHTPMIMDHRVLELKYERPVILKSLYGNTFNLDAVEIMDPLIRTHTRTEEIEAFTRDKPMFAISDNGLNTDMKNFLRSRYPTPSRWETSV